MMRGILAFGGLALLLSLAGCGETGSDSGGRTVIVEQCGPNARLHGGLGNAEPHCDCVDGYTLYNGDCVPDNSRDDDNDANAGGESVANEPASEPRSTTRALPATCWRPLGSECDPRDAMACNLSSGETCDIIQTPDGVPNLVCLEGPNTQGIGDTCDPSSGPFCGVGFHCVPPGVCERFCCDDSECPEDMQCVPFAAAAGTLGLCDDDNADRAPACGPPGAPCRSGSECCSNDCHSGHCH